MSPTPRQIRDLSVGLALSAVSTAAAVHAQPRVIYADASAPAGGNGTTWNAAYRDLQDALAAANADPQKISRGVEIRLSQGIYKPARGAMDRSQAFAFTSGVTLMGGFAGLAGGANADQRNPGQFVSVLSGDLAGNDGPNFTNYSDNSRCIVDSINSDRTVLDGLEIVGGNADATSPGPRGVVAALGINAGGTLRGGKIALLNNCRILRNRGTTAPILSMYFGVVRGTTVGGNWTQNQPIIDSRSSFLNSCRVMGNRATGTPGEAGSIITLSSAGDPQGVSRLTQCLVVDNTSEAWGAVRSISAQTVELFNCTVARNTSVSGEAIWHAINPLRMRNCVVSGNVRNSSPPTAAQIAVWNPLVFDIDISVLIDNGGAGVRYMSSAAIPGPYLSGDPKFASPNGPDGNPLTWQDNDYRLRSGSPAVDRANATDPIFAPGFTDLDGMPLFDDPGTINSGFGAVTYGDLGCFEYQRIITGDFDNSGTITVSDIFAFLTTWFAGNPLADLDGNGIGTSDIFAFLSAWFASI